MRFAIFGDTGGHVGALKAGLDLLGLVGTALPDDLQVIHLGDLVHRGPNSSDVVELVDALQRENPGQWHQLVGNHEAMHLGILTPFYPCNCSSEAVSTLQRWWDSGEMRASYGLSGVAPRKWTAGSRPLGQEQMAKEILFTHGGLTEGFWKEHLQSPTRVEEAVERLNALPQSILGTEGEMISGLRNFAAGPIWAAGAEEAAASWAGQPMPFSQAVGHTTPYVFTQESWRFSAKRALRDSGTGVAVPREHRAVAFVGGELFLFQDPGYGKTSPGQPQPTLLIEAEEIF